MAKNTKQYRNRGWLRKKYIEEGLSTIQISKMCNVNDWTIGQWLRKYNIPTRNGNEATLFANTKKPYANPEWLRTKYLKEKLSMYRIAKLCHVNDHTISHWIHRFNIPTRKTKVYKKGLNHFSWKKGRFKSREYTLLYKPNHPNSHHNHILEHRFVMSQYLGRPLYPWEIVHHKNGVKTDNRIENLELLARKEHSNGMETLQTKIAVSLAQIKSIINQPHRQIYFGGDLS